jgi:hypothetical protein
MKTIELTRGMVALVDDDDFTRFGHLSWYAQPGWRSTFYAARRLPRKEGGTMIWLHKEIMNATPNDFVDHRSGNTLDNQKFNLRVCTNAENGRNRVRPNKNNTSGFKGVYWHKGAKKWMAQIKVAWKSKYLGLFDSEESAARAHNAAAIKFHGEFASLNTIRNEHPQLALGDA